LNPQTQPSAYFDKIEGNEDKKLSKAKETIEEAIILLQGRLEDLSRAIEETESIDAVLEIAKRVRNSKRVLFNDSNGPMVQSLIGFKCPRPLKKGANGGITRIPKPTSAFESLQGKRKTMEDTHTAIDDLNKPFPNLSKTVRRSYYGVYDGHSGRDAAILAQDHLHKNIIGDPAFMEGDFVKAILNGYRRTDKFILEVAARDQWKNGTTSVSALVINNMLYIANCGDSEAVMAKKKPHGLEAVEISAKHKPNDPKEKKRIEDLGMCLCHLSSFSTSLFFFPSFFFLLSFLIKSLTFSSTFQEEQCLEQEYSVHSRFLDPLVIQNTSYPSLKQTSSPQNLLLLLTLWKKMWTNSLSWLVMVFGIR
jgi:hypothetical protein